MIILEHIFSVMSNEEREATLTTLASLTCKGHQDSRIEKLYDFLALGMITSNCYVTNISKIQRASLWYERLIDMLKPL